MVTVGAPDQGGSRRAHEWCLYIRMLGERAQKLFDLILLKWDEKLSRALWRSECYLSVKTPGRASGWGR